MHALMTTQTVLQNGRLTEIIQACLNLNLNLNFLFKVQLTMCGYAGMYCKLFEHYFSRIEFCSSFLLLIDVLIKINKL
jgi:hypothetical protein